MLWTAQSRHTERWSLLAFLTFSKTHAFLVVWCERWVDRVTKIQIGGFTATCVYWNYIGICFLETSTLSWLFPLRFKFRFDFSGDGWHSCVDVDKIGWTPLHSHNITQRNEVLRVPRTIFSNKRAVRLLFNFILQQAYVVLQYVRISWRNWKLNNMRMQISEGDSRSNPIRLVDFGPHNFSLPHPYSTVEILGDNSACIRWLP